ncbi:MAG: selenite/tellurite reduction operon porin ExtI [Gammaproteobacteria bacterium]|nr:selenite/tellurite reduction operon porin ExtI [Gammaproteobacteria bacterium]MCW8911127.1 selenite/tellurite reduction operon porin ExtI [Gammaproteobacteria bacterium]MCW9004929.1 selenite/tellurite reduction operon porin ExtI [Gammaproteobacteria bacterium]MCW9056325.1 selenite/tellurite reduction operon porin ExtI [Gammaproteobacteria bacterium]
MKNNHTAKQSVKRLQGLAGGIALALMPVVATAGASIQVGEQGVLNINYALQVWAQFKEFRSATDSGDSFDTFLRRNRITFSGQYDDLVGYYAQIEAGSDSRNGNDNRSLYYRDAYVTLDYSDSTRFIIGRFKNTFSRENLEACLEPLTLDRSEVISYTPFAGTRDTGVAMWGNLADATFQYRIMLADGREGEEAAEDSPRFTARFHWSPLDPEYDYGYRGTYLGTSRIFTVGVAYDYQPNVAYANYTARSNPVDYTGITADIFYEEPTASGTYTLSGAYFEYDADDAINNSNHDSALPVTTQLEASYFKVGYLFPEKMGAGRLQLFARHETSDYKVTSTNLDQTWSSIGANYYIDGQRLKITGEVTQVAFDEEDTADASRQDYGQATIGLQLIF